MTVEAETPGRKTEVTARAKDAVLADAQSRARAAGAGFWAARAAKPRCTGLAPRAAPAAPGHRTAPVEPSAPVEPAAPGFRGNINSRLYHAASCPNANCRNCSRLFASEAEAKMAGVQAGRGLLQGSNPGTLVPDETRFVE